MPSTLEIYRGPTVVGRVRLQGRAVTLGRGEGVDVELADVPIADTPAVVEPTAEGHWRLRLGTSPAARRGAILLRDGEAVPLGALHLIVRDDPGHPGAKPRGVEGEGPLDRGVRDNPGHPGGTALSLASPTRLAQAHEVAAQAGGAAANLYLEYAGKRWPVGRRPLTVGTAADCDVVVEDATVSRHHCRLEPRGELLFVRDLGSTNGTQVDEVTILEAMVRPGARLRIGNTCLHLDARERPMTTPGPDHFHGMVGATPAMRELYRLLERIAATDAPVLIAGETGTGKELAARAIHAASGRRNGPLVVVNCGAIPEELIESELFGHMKGSFTGAYEDRAGKFELAHTGTLFLDEIGDMSVNAQAKVLRALQEGIVTRVGGAKPTPVDVRVLAATNKELEEEIRGGRFREDLFYRLNVFPMTLNPLAERIGDIAPLAFAMILRHHTKGQPIPWLSDSALAVLRAHKRPGNVRELENVIRRALLLAQGKPAIWTEHIIFDTAVRPVAAEQPAAPKAEAPVHQNIYEVPPSGARRLSKIVRQSEANAIMETLDACNGRRAEAARQLGISERTLRYRLASFREAGIAVGAAR